MGYTLAPWRIRLNRPCAAAVRPYAKLLWPLVVNVINVCLSIGISNSMMFAERWRVSWRTTWVRRVPVSSICRWAPTRAHRRLEGHVAAIRADQMDKASEGVINLQYGTAAVRPSEWRWEAGETSIPGSLQHVTSSPGDVIVLANQSAARVASRLNILSVVLKLILKQLLAFTGIRATFS